MVVIGSSRTEEWGQVQSGRETITRDDPRLAFDRLTQARLDRAYRLAVALLRDQGEAEDAVQDAALQAWAGWKRLRDESRFDAWFDRILVNRCRDQMRRHVQAYVAVGPLTAGERDPASDSAERMAIGQSTLSADHQIVVTLRFMEDLSINEIATRTGQREGTVKSRLHYALRQLRAAYEAASRSAGDTR